MGVKRGSPAALRMAADFAAAYGTPAERMAANTAINTATGCLEWTAGRSSDGYGQLSLFGTQTRAHRLAYELAHGPIPDGLVIDHLCRNRLCCNPDHLEPVTIAENVMRGVSFAPENAAKTHCRHGHEFTSENTYWRLGGRWRGCRACNGAAVRRYVARRAEAAV